MGSMFRYERPQAGRYREFYQIGAEYFGNAAPSADAEIILLARDVLRSAGIPEMDIHVHTLGCPACRPVFRQKLVEFLSSRTDLCADCQRRIAVNPLRVLDCKIDGQKLEGFPEMMHCLCPACRVHFDQVQELLKSAGCSFRIDPRLVRGLDYYTRTIFEIRSSSLGSQDALAAGGRYDNLVEELGGPSTPAVGFALGSERVMLAAEKTNAARGIVQPQTVFIAVSGQTVAGDAFAVASRLREMPQDSAVWKTLVTGAAPVSVEGPFADRSLKSQLRLADRVGAVKVIIFGEEELKRGMVVIRDMKTQQQEERNLQSFV
jgi:histidyl-tRNA synthetase